MMKIALMKNNRSLTHNGYSQEEQGEIYDLLLQDLYDNPRWYLDNLQYLSVFYVNWKNYRYNTPVLPLKYVKKHNSL